MFLIVAVELGVVWVVGVLYSYTIGGYIHILPVLATAVLLFGFVRGSVRARMVTAAILIALGLAAFTYEGIRYMAGGEDVKSVAVQAQSGTGYPAPLAPLAGGIALMAGFILLPSQAHRASSGVNTLGSTPDRLRMPALAPIKSMRGASYTWVPGNFQHVAGGLMDARGESVAHINN